LLLLISHAPARLLPTIRSRCRRLALRPLSADDVARAAALALGRDAKEPELREASALSEGSVGRALSLLEGPALALRKRVVDLLERLPAVDPQALHALGDAIGGFEPQRLASFIDAVNEWLADRLASADRDRMLRIAEAWDKVNQAAHDADEYNLERKPLVFSVFGWLAEAARP
jgi:DNA polymerase-3 subunit delta'